ncbi:MAG: Crp/Fnr family transcriptional regulator [Chitinophagales bacterium]
MLELLKERYLYVFEAKLIEEMASIGNYRKIKEDTTIMDIGDSIEYMPLLLSGSIKIMREDEEDGGELLLYYLEVGDTCAMTLNCCLRKTKSNIRAVAEIYTELVMIPVHKMVDWIVQYESWRVFVFESYNTRLNEMLEAIDNLAFNNMEERLYKYLTNKAFVAKSSNVVVTHFQIGSELNSSRVVISRLLKKLERDGKIKLHRNLIEVPNYY